MANRIPIWNLYKTTNGFISDTARTEDTVSFILESGQIFIGEAPCTNPIKFVVEFPTIDIMKGIIYIKTSTFEGRQWNGTQWLTVIQPLVDSIVNAEDNCIVSVKALKDYIHGLLETDTPVDMSSIDTVLTPNALNAYLNDIIETVNPVNTASKTTIMTPNALSEYIAALIISDIAGKETDVEHVVTPKAVHTLIDSLIIDTVTDDISAEGKVPQSIAVKRYVDQKTEKVPTTPYIEGLSFDPITSGVVATYSDGNKAKTTLSSLITNIEFDTSMNKLRFDFPDGTYGSASIPSSSKMSSYRLSTGTSSIILIFEDGSEFTINIGDLISSGATASILTKPSSTANVKVDTDNKLIVDVAISLTEGNDLEVVLDSGFEGLYVPKRMSKIMSPTQNSIVIATSDGNVRSAEVFISADQIASDSDDTKVPTAKTVYSLVSDKIKDFKTSTKFGNLLEFYSSGDESGFYVGYGDKNTDCPYFIKFETGTFDVDEILLASADGKAKPSNVFIATYIDDTKLLTDGSNIPNLGAIVDYMSRAFTTYDQGVDVKISNTLKTFLTNIQAENIFVEENDLFKSISLESDWDGEVIIDG